MEDEDYFVRIKEYKDSKKQKEKCEINLFKKNKPKITRWRDKSSPFADGEAPMEVNWSSVKGADVRAYKKIGGKTYYTDWSDTSRR